MKTASLHCDNVYWANILISYIKMLNSSVTTKNASWSKAYSTESCWSSLGFSTALYPVGPAN